MKRTSKRLTHTLADIDALIDSVARARLRRAVKDAVQCPSPANVAALEEWPCEWVAEEQAESGVPRDLRRPPLIAETAGEVWRRLPDFGAAPGAPASAGTTQSDASAWSFWKWITRKWFSLLEWPVKVG